MSMANAQVTQLSSVGISPMIGLDPLSKMTAVQITTSSSFNGDATTGSATFLIQVTLDVPYTGSPPARWASLSSVAFVASSAGNTLLNSDNTALLTLLEPVAGLRIQASAVSSGSIFLRALQSPAA